MEEGTSWLMKTSLEAELGSYDYGYHSVNEADTNSNNVDDDDNWWTEEEEVLYAVASENTETIDIWYADEDEAAIVVASEVATEEEISNRMSSNEDELDNGNFRTDKQEISNSLSNTEDKHPYAASASEAGFLQGETIGEFIVSENEFFKDIQDEDEVIANMELGGPEVVSDLHYNILLPDGNVYRLTNFSQAWLDGDASKLRSGKDTIGVMIAGNSTVLGANIDMGGGQPVRLTRGATMSPTSKVRNHSAAATFPYCSGSSQKETISLF